MIQKHSVQLCTGNSLFRKEGLTYSMARCFLAQLIIIWSKMFPRLWNTDFHFRVHKSLLLHPVLSQLNPIYNLTTHFSKIHIHIILQPASRPSNSCLVVRLSLSVYALFIVAIHATVQACLIVIDLITLN
jgi:hypothetical protein